MEKKIKSFNELKVGDLVLIESPASKTFKGKVEDDLCVVSSIIPTYKYPIGDQSGRKYYMKDRKPVYADECGETGKEMINKLHLTSSTIGEYNFREDEEPIWNIRLIDETHPRWDSKFSNHGKKMDGIINMFGNLLGKSI